MSPEPAPSAASPRGGEAREGENLETRAPRVRDIRSGPLADDLSRIPSEHNRQIDLILQEKARIEKERMSLREEDEAVQRRIEEVKNIKLAPEEIDLIEKKEEREKELAFVTMIVQSKRDIYSLLLKKDIEGAKDVYRKIKRSYDSLSASMMKKDMHKELIAVYDQISLLAKGAREEKLEKKALSFINEDKTTKAIMSHLKTILLGIKTDLARENIAQVHRDLAEAHKLAGDIPDKGVRAHAITMIEAYQEKIGVQKGGVQPGQKRHEADDLYAKGVAFLFNKKKKEAAAIFHEILAKNPDNQAARMRLKEAEVTLGESEKRA